jgi:hypothetical protein
MDGVLGIVRNEINEPATEQIPVVTYAIEFAPFILFEKSKRTEQTLVQYSLKGITIFNISA